MATTKAPFATFFGSSLRDLSTCERGSTVAFGATVQSAPPRRAGAELGPAAIREASCDALRPYLASPSRTALEMSSGNLKRLRDLSNFSDLGDLDCVGPASIAQVASVAQVATTVAAQGGLPVVLGGDQRVFEGLVRGLQQSSQTPAILAFSDKICLPGTIDAAPLPLAELVASSQDRCPLLCLGVNGLQPGKAWDATHRVGGRVVSVDQIHDEPMQIRDLLEGFIQCHQSIVCCLDLEIVDSGHAAGTPSINVGGLTPEQLLALVSEIDLARTLSGVAVTNVAPNLDARGLSEVAAIEALMALLGSRLFTESTH